MADKVSTFRAELTAGVDGFVQGMTRASGSVKKLEGDVGGIGQAFKGLDQVLSGFGVSLAGLASVGGAAIALKAAGSAIADLASQAEKWGNIAASTGLGVEDVQRLSAYLTDAGIDGDLLKKAMKALSEEAATGGKKLAEFGVSIKGWETKTQEERLRAMARTIADVEDPATQAALASAAFGKAGVDLIPVMEGVADGADKMYDALSKGSVASLQAADNAIDAFSRKLDSAKKRVLAGIVELAQGLTILPGGIPVFVPNVNALADAAAGAAPKAGATDAEKQRQVREREARAEAERQKGAAEAARAQAKALAEAAREAEREAKALGDAMKASFDETAKRNEAQANLLRLLGPLAEDAAVEMGRLASATQRLGGVSALSDAQLVKFVDSMREQIKLGGENEYAMEAYAAATEEAAARSLATSASIEKMTESNRTFNESVREDSEAFRELDAAAQRHLANIQKALAEVAGAFEILGQVGQEVGGKLGSALEQLGQMGQNLAEGFATGDFTKAFDQALGLIAKGVGSLLHKEEQDVNDLRDEFFKTQGGFVELQKKLVGLSNQDLVKKIFDAKTVKDYNSAVAEVMDLLDTQAAAQQALQEAVDRYGFSVEQLGPAMQRQQLDEQAGQLLQDWRLLVASGINVNDVMAKMGPNLGDFVRTSIAAGQAIPQAMQPMIDQFIASGQLLDENGNAYESAEAAGITYSQTMSEMFETLIEKIDRFVSALTGIPSETNTTVNVRTRHSTDGQQPNGAQGALPGELPPGVPPPDLPSFAEGTMGVYEDFGRGTLAILHGREKITPLGAADGGGTTVNVQAAFNSNPWQTAETARQMDEHMVDLLDEWANNNLASAIANGAA